MAFCTQCGAQVPDGSEFCTSCGSRIENGKVNLEKPAGEPHRGAPGYQDPMPSPTPTPAPQTPPPYTAQPYTGADPFDHTGEFDPKDISDNKVMAMLVYLMGIVGVFLATIAGLNSPYASFHVRQSLKFAVIESLAAIVTLLLCWTLIIPAAAGIFYIVLYVVKIICFFDVCAGRAKEPPIIRSFTFLK